MAGEQDAATIAAFIRSNGVTRCPTACVLPTQAAPGPADRAALARHAAGGPSRPQARRRRFAEPPRDDAVP